MASCISPFNSLYGILSFIFDFDNFCVIYFQFPLWDSKPEEDPDAIYLIYFQFPLWDSNVMAEEKVEKVGFQFPLWDSRPHEFPLRFLFTPLKGSLIYLIRNLLKCFTASDKPILQNSKLSYPKMKKKLLNKKENIAVLFVDRLDLDRNFALLREEMEARGGISEDLRGWSWIKNSRVKPLSEFKLSVSEVTHRYCPTYRDIYLKRIAKVNAPPSIKTIRGIAYHEVFHEASLKIKQFIYNNKIISGGDLLSEFLPKLEEFSERIV